MPSITPVPRGSNLHLKRTELYTERLFLKTTQPSAGLLAGTMDELLVALLSLWQRCPHGFPLAISLPSPFSWTWKLWQWSVHLTPYLATLISCSEDVLLHSCGGRRNSIQSTGTCKEQLLSCFDKRTWAGFHGHRAIPQISRWFRTLFRQLTWRCSNLQKCAGNFKEHIPGIPRTFLAFAREKQHSVTAC